FIKTTWLLKTRNLVTVHEFPADILPDEVIQAVIKGSEQFSEAVQRVEGPLDADVQKMLDKREIELEVRQERGKLLVTTEREEVVYHAPMPTLIDPEDVCVNADAPFNLQEADHLIHRYWMTPAEIKTRVRKGTFTATKDELAELTNLATTNASPDDNTVDVKE